MNITFQRPSWAETLRQKYLAGESSVFILYGNVYDLVLWEGKSFSLSDYLINGLFKENKKNIFELSLKGTKQIKTDGEQASIDKIFAYQENNQGLIGSLAAMERRLKEKDSTSVIIPYAETLLPNGDPQFLSSEERVTLTSLHSWSLDETISNNDNVIVLITESISSINQALLSNPKIAAIEVKVPEYDKREQAIHYFAPKMTTEQVNKMALHTSGLKLLQIKSIVASDKPGGMNEDARKKLIVELLHGETDAEQRAEKMTQITSGMAPEEIVALVNPNKENVLHVEPDEEMYSIVRKRKREIIEKECSGLLEFVDAKNGLDAVGGNDNIKGELMSIAQTFKNGNRKTAPMGLLAVGAMGSGKTFVIKAFLKEAGLSGVILKNFRSKWQGATESNLEKVLSTVKAMGPIAVVIDEGDRSFGKGEGSGETDGGTSSRIIARIKEFMSDTENRGQVLFILMTNRPDKLDTDLKRPGRLDRKIPFFYAETEEEQANIIKAILTRYKASEELPWDKPKTICSNLENYSNADLEAVSLLSMELAERQGSKVTLDIFKQASNDFIPPRESKVIEFMELLAVKETSRKSLLPKRFQDITNDELENRIAELKRYV